MKQHIFVARRTILLTLLAFVAILPALAGVEDEWGDLFSKGQQAYAAKDYAAAESLYNRALQKAKLFGQNDVRVASTLEALGVTSRRLKKLMEAEELIRRAASIFASAGNKGLDFAQAQYDLAQVLMDEGKYDDALQSTKILLPMFDRTLEPDDDKIAGALCVQGDAYRMLKLYASAEAPLKRCADIRSENGNVAEAEFGEAANSLALVYQHLGKYNEADRYFNLTEKIREKTLGLLSPELADTLEAHAALLHQLGRDDEAKPKERMAAAIRSHTNKK